MMKYLNKTNCYAGMVMLVSCNCAYALDYLEHPKLVELVDVMVREDDYPQAQLAAVFDEAVIDRRVIRSMNHQYEALPWHEYRLRFINNLRIRQGVEWWARHESTLAQAEQKFGVPAEIIVALAGVETNFGTNKGNRRVLDALVTLTAAYPRRSTFFGRELRAFLNTTRAEDIAPDSVFGSFAGAVGIPQFMPTSYEAYAVDLNQNGRRDLVNETEDAIGSIANYLKRRGWRTGRDIFVPLPYGIPPTADGLVGKRSKPRLSAAQLNAAGVDFHAVGSARAGTKFALLRLREEEGYRYFIGYHNFHVITRYNPSINYAMAVAELAMLIRQQREQ